jgi:hypothetical protein
LLFSLLKFCFGGGGREMWTFFIFSWFPMCSHYLPFKFPMGYHQVLNMFPKFRICVPQHFSIKPHFYPICLGKWCPPFHLYSWAKGEDLYIKMEPSILGSLHSFINLLQKKNWPWEAPHLINRRGE